MELILLGIFLVIFQSETKQLLLPHCVKIIGNFVLQLQRTFCIETVIVNDEKNDLKN